MQSGSKLQEGLEPGCRNGALARVCELQPQVKNMGSSFRQPLYRIELPGYPILSDGKADNQNHALPFSRGTITQCVDSNQGAAEAPLVAHRRLNKYTFLGQVLILSK